MYEHLKAEWTKDCNCEGVLSFRFKNDDQAKEHWFNCLRKGDISFACHGPSGHLLTIHVPGLCSCSDCTSTNNG